MEDFALVEADFQQYYHLNIDELCPYQKVQYEGDTMSRIGFMRYARLFSNLPKESRLMLKLNPLNNWSWQDETLSRILQQLNLLTVAYSNMHRAKGATPSKPDEQFQPDYVKEAKDEIQEELKASTVLSEDDLAAQAAFWESRNPAARRHGV